MKTDNSNHPAVRLGKFIKEQRIGAGLTLGMLARKMRIKPSVLSNIEFGIGDNLTGARYDKIRDLCRLDDETWKFEQLVQETQKSTILERRDIFDNVDELMPAFPKPGVDLKKFRKHIENGSNPNGLVRREESSCGKSFMTTRKIIALSIAFITLFTFTLRADITNQHDVQFIPNMESVLKNLEIHGLHTEAKDIKTREAQDRTDTLTYEKVILFEGKCWAIDKNFHKIYPSYFVMKFRADGVVTFDVSYNPSDVVNYSPTYGKDDSVPVVSPANIH